ncbi:uncharacterized protein LOC123447853 [Hordeum vulgare subsp. vulgare]|uniref:uncharacterized protein LOC123447853 n=1 Tax=Hordeum vulgare subsp. vulgare TaxID=112509 RepID=UPI001D1A3AFF|nr:uncharacterized protein LOC123447853 [Hordeum vulgare subsp. vulgare]
MNDRRAGRPKVFRRRLRFSVPFRLFPSPRVGRPQGMRSLEFSLLPNRVHGAMTFSCGSGLNMQLQYCVMLNIHSSCFVHIAFGIIVEVHLSAIWNYCCASNFKDVLNPC